MWWLLGVAFGHETHETQDAVLRDGLLWLVSPDGTTLSAIDLAAGVERFEISLGAPDLAAVIHDLGEHRLLVQSPSQYTTVDLTLGQVIAQRPAPGEWTFVWQSMGAVGLRSPCRFTPISREDGRQLGELLAPRTYRWSGEFDEDGRSFSGCYGDFEVLGAARGLSLYFASALDDSPLPVVLAIDTAGVERWRSRSLCRTSPPPLGAGVAPDGLLCWVTERDRPGSLTVRAFSCETGKVRFETPMTIDAKTAYDELVTGFVPTPPSILVSSRGRATALTPEGKVRWSRSQTDDVLVVPTGLVTPNYPLALDAFHSIESVSPATGERLEHLLAPDGSEIRISARGTPEIALAGGTSDRGGARVAAPEVFVFIRDRSGSRALLRGQEVLSLPADGWVIGEHRNEEHTWLVVAQPREGKPDLVLILED